MNLALKYFLGCYWIPRICWKSWASRTYCKSIVGFLIDVLYKLVVENLKTK